MIWPGSSYRGLAVLTDGYDGPPDDQNPWLKWICGVALPLAMAAFGVWEFAARDAVGAAVIIICLALFAHFHYFWSLNERLQPFSELAKSIALVPVVGTLFYGVYYVIVYR